LPEDDKGYRGSNVVLLSYSFWQTRLGASTSVIGEKLVLDGSPYIVIGVLPAGFRYPGEPLTGSASDIDLWLPLASNPLMSGGGPVRSLRFLKVIGRLRPDARVEQARDELRGIGEALAAEHPDTNRGFDMGFQSLTAQVTGRARAPLYLLLGAVGLVLLMACANVANLLLASTAARHKEITIRVALGASRARLLRQLFTEGLVLAIAGGAAGVLLANWTLKLILSVAPAALAHRVPLQLDGSALVFSMCVVLLSAVLSTLPLGIGIVRSEIGESLKEHGRGAAGASQSFQFALIVAQMALALVLVIGAGLLIRSFVRLLAVDPGFQAQNLVTISTQVPSAARKPDQRTAVYRRIADQVLAMPGVRGIGAVSRLPLMGSNLGSWLTIEGRQLAADEKPEVEYRVATPSYFPVMGIPLLQGRLFDDRDDANPAAVVLINQTAARRYFPNDNPVGKRIKFGSGVEKLPWISIIGVVGDTRHFGLETEPRPEAYRPYAHNPLYAPILVIRTARDPGPMIGALTGAIRSVKSRRARL
jgi:predicted permease